MATVIKASFEHLEGRIDGLEGRFDGLEGRVGNLEQRMATKEDLGKLKLDLIDAMSEKNAELRGDLIILMRKEDKKVIHLVELLKKKTILSDAEAKSILTLELFPQLIL